MTKHLLLRRTVCASSVVLLAVLTVVSLTRNLHAGQGKPQEQQQGQQGQNQGQQQEKPEKKGGFFSTMKAISGSSSEQTSATASAGSKGVGEGEKIGNVTPTPADRQAVTAMENYSVPKGDLGRFIEDGHLKPEQ